MINKVYKRKVASLLGIIMAVLMVITSNSIYALADQGDVDEQIISVSDNSCVPDYMQSFNDEGTDNTGAEKIEIVSTLTTDDILVNLKGVSITTSKDSMIDRINKYRKEACEKGYPDPRDPSRKLEASDYKPIKWSAEMEAIARLRAAESSVYLAHERPNNTSCFSIKLTNGIQSYGEVLAWNYEKDENTTMYGIEQWYGEKSDWVDQKKGTVTGHYTMMINPSNEYIGISSFRSYLGGWTSTAGEINGYNTLTEDKDSSAGDISIPIEVNKKFVKKIFFSDNQKKAVGLGESINVSLRASVQFVSDIKTIDMEGKIPSGITWSSSDDSIATVSPEGVVTGISEGVAVITGEVAGKAYSINISVGEVKGGKVEISGLASVAIEKSYTYVKGGCKPPVEVSVNGRILKKGKDYKVTYKNYNTSKGTVIITGKKNYKGKMSFDYDIKNQDLKNIDTYIKDVIYKEKPDNYVVKADLTDVNGKKLKAKKDYDGQFEYFYCTVSGNVIRRLNPGETAEAGKYIKAVVKPVPGGHYEGETFAIYRLVNKSISSVKVKQLPGFNIQNVRPEMMEVKYKGQVLTPGVDYEVKSAVINSKSTKITVVLHGLGEYGCTRKVAFKIQ